MNRCSSSYWYVYLYASLYFPDAHSTQLPKFKSTFSVMPLHGRIECLPPFVLYLLPLVLALSLI